MTFNDITKVILTKYSSIIFLFLLFILYTVLDIDNGLHNYVQLFPYRI